MKKYDYLFILTCIFVFRVILLSASYADALCLLAILGYHFADRYVQAKKSSEEVVELVKKNNQLSSAQLEVMSQEIQKTKSVVEMLKATTSFLNKK